MAATMEEWLHLPNGIMESNSKISLIGSRELCMEGCKGILEYTDGLIRIHCGNRQLKVLGRNLSVRVLERDYVEVEGIIFSLTFD